MNSSLGSLDYSFHSPQRRSSHRSSDLDRSRKKSESGWSNGHKARNWRRNSNSGESSGYDSSPFSGKKGKPSGRRYPNDISSRELSSNDQRERVRQAMMKTRSHRASESSGRLSSNSRRKSAIIETGAEMKEYLNGLIKRCPIKEKLQNGIHDDIRPCSSKESELSLSFSQKRKSSRIEELVSETRIPTRRYSTNSRRRNHDHSESPANGERPNKRGRRHRSPSLSKKFNPESFEKFTLFFTKKYPFSNHYPCNSLVIEGSNFLCTEQYYMYMKARTFNDNEAARDIMALTDPKRMKQRSNSIRGFNKAMWDTVSQNIMRLASKKKYEQNPELRRSLFETHGTTLVETNPTDQQWGIGLSMDDFRAQDRKCWRGQNLLGQILTELREELWAREEYKAEVKEVKRMLKRKRQTI